MGWLKLEAKELPRFKLERRAGRGAAGLWRGVRTHEFHGARRAPLRYHPRALRPDRSGRAAMAKKHHAREGLVQQLRGRAKDLGVGRVAQNASRAKVILAVVLIVYHSTICIDYFIQ